MHNKLQQQSYLVNISQNTICEEIRRLKGQFEQTSGQVCAICFEEYKEDRKRVAFGPCGHSSCNECMHLLQLCPFCRAEIEFDIPLVNN